MELLSFFKGKADRKAGDIETADGEASRQAIDSTTGQWARTPTSHAAANIALQRNMPFRFYGQQQDPSGTDHHQGRPSRHHGALSGIYQAAQTLGSIGAPAANLRPGTLGTTSAGTDDLYFSTDPESLKGRDTFAPSMNSGFEASAPASAPPVHTSQFDPPRRMQSYGRQPEELHIPSSNRAMGDVRHGQSQYQNPPAYGGNGAPAINLQQSPPQHSDFSGQHIANSVPGALQPGPVGRPGPLSANTAPSSIPTLPQISTQQPATPSRAATMNHTHSYSRSSPAGFDQQTYKPFNNTPENSKYASPGTSNYAPHTPQTSSNSPLGLADIRPRADTGLSDGPTSPGAYGHNGEMQIPTNSTYVAPWSIYALDWCKWPSQPHGTSAGKVAMGSYLEDSHNFVSLPI